MELVMLLFLVMATLPANAENTEHSILPHTLPVSTPTPSTPNTNTFLPLSAETIALGYALPGECTGFSPDGKILATTFGVYEVATGKKRFFITGDNPYNPAFSPDGSLLALQQDGVYEVATGKKRFGISGDNPTFSPDGTLLAVEKDGIYEVAKGKKRFDLFGYNPVFSPDGTLFTLVTISGSGIYEVATGKERFPITGYHPVFSPDGLLLAVPKDGLYEVATGNKRFDISNNTVSFSPDGTLLAVASDGIYDTAAGNKLLDTPSSSSFSPDGTLLAITTNGICVLYGSAKNQWPFQVGVIRASSKNIRRKPNTTAVILGTADGVFEVIGRTTKGDWYQVIYGDGTGWIAASVVNVVLMPDDIPIVTP